MYLGGCLNNLPLRGTSRVVFVVCICSHDQYNPIKKIVDALNRYTTCFPISHCLLGHNDS